MFLRTTSSTPPKLEQVAVNSEHIVAHITSLLLQVVWICKNFKLHDSVCAIQELITVCLNKDKINNTTDKMLYYSLTNISNKVNVHAYVRPNWWDTVVLTGTFGRGEYTYVEKLLTNWELPHQSLVLDLWATIWDFWLYLKYIGLDPYLVCVEWDPQAAEVCAHNLAENILDWAVIDKPITADWRQVTFAATWMTTRRKITDTNWTDCSSITLSEIMDEFYGEIVDLCKIDIEWGEFELLTKENRVYFDRMKHIILEYHTTFDRFATDISTLQTYFGDMFTFQREKPLLKKSYAWGTIIWLIYMKHI